MNLSPADEYFTHQVSFPHSMVGSSDPSWRERYWFSIQDTERRDVVMTCGVGRYPNQDVMEGFAIAAAGGRQHNVRLSRSLGPRGNDTVVGPLSIEVVEPLKALRLRLEDNPSGVAFDLEWRARVEPLLEGRHFQIARSRVIHDLCRYVQVGRATGRLEIAGTTYDVHPQTWWGERDHSWGLRPLPHVQGAPPPLRPEWKFLLFCPLQFEHFGIHLYAYESEPGRPLYLSAGLMYPEGAATDANGAPDNEVPDNEVMDDEAITAVEHDLHFADGAAAATLVGGSITLHLSSGRRLHVELTAQPGRVLLKGGGYNGMNGWFQGHWKGDDSLEHESWDLTDPADLRANGRASSDHLVEARCDGEVGYGIVEYMILRGYPKYAEAQR